MKIQHKKCHVKHGIFATIVGGVRKGNFVFAELCSDRDYVSTHSVLRMSVFM